MKKTNWKKPINPNVKPVCATPLKSGFCADGGKRPGQSVHARNRRKGKRDQTRSLLLFKNKEDLCASIIEDHETVFRRQMEKVQQRAQGPEEVLYEGLLSHLNFL